MTEPKPKLTSRMGETAYVISVLWIAGWSAGRIALVTDKLKGSVKGIAQRRFEKSRDVMTLEERQAMLDEFRSDRRDGGKLADKHFVALPLRAVQQKRLAGSMVGSKLLTARKEEAAKTKPVPVYQSRKELRRLKREEEFRRAQREHGHAERRGDKAAALEHLAGRGILTDAEDRVANAFKKDIGRSGVRRLEAGLSLRKYIAGMRVGGLKSIDYEATSVGSALGLPPTAFKFQCMETVGDIRSMMTKADFALIEAVVDQDDFPWERVGGPEKKGQRDSKAERARAAIYDNIRRVLDIVAVYERLLTPQGFNARWGYSIPNPDRATRGNAVERAEAATDFLAEAKRTIR